MALRREDHDECTEEATPDVEQTDDPAQARGDAEKFNSQLAEYLKAPEVTRQRLYLEAMSAVFPQLERKIILDEKAGQLYPLLSIDPNAKLP